MLTMKSLSFMGGPVGCECCVRTPFCRLGAARHFPCRHQIRRALVVSSLDKSLAREGARAWARRGGGGFFLHGPECGDARSWRMPARRYNKTGNLLWM